MYRKHVTFAFVSHGVQASSIQGQRLRIVTPISAFCLVPINARGERRRLLQTYVRLVSCLQTGNCFGRSSSLNVLSPKHIKHPIALHD